MRSGSVVIRRMRSEDAGTVRGWLQDESIKWRVSISPVLEGEEYIRSLPRDPYFFLLETRADGTPIGFVCARDLDPFNRHATVDLVVAEESARGGRYAFDGWVAFLDYLFNKVNLHKVKAAVLSGNESAASQIERFGFRREGVLREEVLRDGKASDLLLFGLCRPEFDALEIVERWRSRERPWDLGGDRK